MKRQKLNWDLNHHTFLCPPNWSNFYKRKIILKAEQPSPGSLINHAYIFKLMKTLHSQSYLSPLPMHINPIYWKHSHALQIYPLPDLLVLCDKYASPYHVAQFGCNTINPVSVTAGPNAHLLPDLMREHSLAFSFANTFFGMNAVVG